LDVAQGVAVGRCQIGALKEHQAVRDHDDADFVKNFHLADEFAFERLVVHYVDEVDHGELDVKDQLEAIVFLEVNENEHEDCAPYKVHDVKDCFVDFGHS
jgi:hypothetical protein